LTAFQQSRAVFKLFEPAFDGGIGSSYYRLVIDST